MKIGLFVGLILLAAYIITEFCRNIIKQQSEDKLEPLDKGGDTEKASSSAVITFDFNEAIKKSILKIAHENNITDPNEIKKIKDSVDSILKGETAKTVANKPATSHSPQAVPVEVAIKQLLESVHVITTTKNVDIFLSRYDFVKKKAQELYVARNNPKYGNCVFTAIEHYKNLYYDRVITNDQLMFIYNPESAYSDDTFGELLYKCYVRYCDKMESEILSLKTKKAKDRRKEKIAESVKLMTPYITTDVLAQHAKNILDMINKRFDIEFNVSVKHE